MSALVTSKLREPRAGDSFADGDFVRRREEHVGHFVVFRHLHYRELQLSRDVFERVHLNEDDENLFGLFVFLGERREAAVRAVVLV